MAGTAARRSLATLAAGCFWGVELTFQRLPGVLSTRVGYTGGHKKDPTYEDVCSGTTGHAEAVRLEYDEDQVTYDELLDVFFAEHDPTQKNRQGPDVGSQYRSAIFYHSPDQKDAAEKACDRHQRRFDRPISTEIVEAGPWYDAEEYHQSYLKKRGRA